MALDSKHPFYTAFAPYWIKLRDTSAGEDAVKAAGEIYLPATEAMRAEGMISPTQSGYQLYEAYKMRSTYPPLVSNAIEVLVGSIWTKPPVIELPAMLEPMREQATLQGEGLNALLMRVHEHQLTTGRVGLLLDLAIDDDGQPRPYVALYEAETIFNWDEGRRDDPNARSYLNLVVLNESEYERKLDLTWDFVEKYRVLILGDPAVNEDKAPGNPVYSAGIFREKSGFDLSQMTVPLLRGQSLDEVPFVFINPKDTLSKPDRPPLLGLANRALTIYRGEADYRQNLFMQAQDTLVVIGSPDDATKSIRIGAGSVLSLPAGADARYIGVSSQGLGEQREALQNDYNYSASMAGQLLDTVSRDKESAEALNTRINAKTASLRQIAKSSAEGLEKILKIAARWYGANPDEVNVKPNLDFADIVLTAKTLVELMTAKSMGAPISLKTIHSLMQDRKLTELSFEEEIDTIESETPLTSGTSDPNADMNAEGAANDDSSEDTSTDPLDDSSGDGDGTDGRVPSGGR
jgi:hypothetical protein